jgi:hypothetical protein
MLAMLNFEGLKVQERTLGWGVWKEISLFETPAEMNE